MTIHCIWITGISAKVLQMEQKIMRFKFGMWTDDN